MLLLCSKILSQDSRILCLLVTHGLEFDQVKNVAFALGVLQLLEQVLVPLAGFVGLDPLFELLRGQAEVLSLGRPLALLRLGSLEVLLTTRISDRLQETRVDLLLVLADGPRDDRLVLLLLHAALEVQVELLLGVADVRIALGKQLLEDVVRQLLTLKSLPEVFPVVLAQSDGLVTARQLNVLVAQHVLDLLRMLGVSLERRVHLVDFRVHSAHLQVNAGDLRMVLSDAGLEDGETSVQILEALADVAGVIVVEGQHDVTVANVRVLDSQKSLLQHDCFSLQFNGL